MIGITKEWPTLSHFVDHLGSYDMRAYCCNPQGIFNIYLFEYSERFDDQQQASGAFAPGSRRGICSAVKGVPAVCFWVLQNFRLGRRNLEWVFVVSHIKFLIYPKPVSENACSGFPSRAATDIWEGGGSLSTRKM